MLKSLEVYERMNLCDALVPKNFPNGSIIIKEVGAPLTLPRNQRGFGESRFRACRNFGHLNSRNSVPLFHRNQFGPA